MSEIAKLHLQNIRLQSSWNTGRLLMKHSCWSHCAQSFVDAHSCVYPSIHTPAHKVLLKPSPILRCSRKTWSPSTSANSFVLRVFTCMNRDETLWSAEVVPSPSMEAITLKMISTSPLKLACRSPSSAGRPVSLLSQSLTNTLWTELFLNRLARAG